MTKMIRRFLHNFILCGVTGWCMEIFFTALHALRRREWKLKGTTSIWMFPIYGSAALLAPLFRSMKHKPLLLRGLTYMTLIFSAEFAAGSFLKRRALCPWDYSRSRFHIKSLVRLDYAPNWFGAGLLFERLLTRNNSHRFQ
ncbi:MAG: putative ABC transporter permease [Candidatus Gastranaerophilales bacterium]|nr:putative ABC transporter permease [Candidatus Gastranaerophilales bacterium]